MTVVHLTLPALKRAKNSVIGNPTAKRALARDKSFVEVLVNCVHDNEALPESSSGARDDLRIEAAHVLASLAYGAYGSSDALRSLLKANAHQALLIAISNFRPSESPVLKAALARALRTLASAIAEVVGPSQWGLQVHVPDIQEESRAALEYIFQVDALDIYLPLLLDPSTQTCTAIAQLLGSALRLPVYRQAVSDWLPSSERHKEPKGKRGWEKTDSASAPNRQGGWVARQLACLLQRKDVKLQEAVLSALAALSKDNPSVAANISRTPPDQTPVPALMMSCCKSRVTSLQLAACLCVTNIARAGTIAHASHTDHTAPMTIIHVMNGLIESETETAQTRTKACHILYYLVSDDKDLCQLAYERGSLTKLASLVKSITPSEASAEWDEDEPDSISSLRAAALTAVAAISLFDTDIRGEVTGTLKLIPYIQISLSHRHVDVRYAACQCVRALSRAVSVLRTNIVDSGLGLAVYQIFCKEDEDLRVTRAAASVICNLVSDFSPLQATLLEQGVIHRLVRMLGSSEPGLILDALWAFKNLVYKSSMDLKRRVMQAIGWSTVASLLVHENLSFQEQAFHILRNIADGLEGIDMVLDELGTEFLLSSLSHALESDNEDVLRQAIYLLGNLANSPAHSHEILATPRILQSLRLCLVDAKADVRRPAVTCVYELIRANPGHHKELHDAGIDSTLRHMCDWSGALLASSPTSRFSHHHHLGGEADREVKEKARDALNCMQLGFEAD